MDREEYDLIIIGGGISATFLCLSIYKINPKYKIIIIEKGAQFPQKIGESVVDMTALFIKSLGVDHLLNKHVVKTGVRFLFNESNSSKSEDQSEFASPTFPGLIKGYHLNRSIFDQQLLEECIKKGCEVLRPAIIKNAEFSDFKNELDVEFNEGIKYIKSKWLVDSSGRARYIVNKLGWKDLQIKLNTGSIMAHFKNIAPAENWDTETNEFWDSKASGPRKFSTTHLMRKNSWWWIIRLDEHNTSIGVVFDKNKIHFEDYEKHFINLLETDAQLSIMTKNAERGPIRYIDKLPYVSANLYSKGIALIGDSGAFIDPLISPGLELISQQSIWIAEMLTKEKETGKFDEVKWKKYNQTFLKAYDSRLIIYKASYDFIHSFDLFTTWLMQANTVYFGKIVYPSIVFKKSLKKPLRFSMLERMILHFFIFRFNKINTKREKQKRISKTKPNTIIYSKVRVPNDYRFYFIPVLLFAKAIMAYLKLEIKEVKN